MTPNDLRRRGDRFKQTATALRRRVTELERELRAVRKAAFAAGSAVTFRECYRAVGIDELTDALAAARGRQSLIDPIIEEMISERTDDLCSRAGIPRIK